MRIRLAGRLAPLAFAWASLGSLTPAIAAPAGAGSPSDLASAATAWDAERAERLKALGLGGDPARGVVAYEVCQGCHLPSALGRTDGSYPRLAGQHATVLVKQMLDIRAGRRFSPKMRPFIDEAMVSTQDIVDIASYLSALPSPPNNGRGAGTELAQGRRIYERECASCHGAGGGGEAGRFYPRLNGQHYEYLLRELVYIRDGVRGNADPRMVEAIRTFSFSDLAAVADYVSRLPSAP
ncbi:c-type cytochrome [Rubrivivax sp. JA1024]|nr:c-type cytochrome [Rubrivivax sp. JA1024]